MSQERIEQWLAAEARQGRVAVLRHRVADPPGGTGGGPASDWDLAVRDPAALARELEADFGLPDLTIRRRYVEQRFYAWNQVDFLPVFEWNGIEYLESGRFWEGVRTGADGLPRPRLAHDALIAWLTGLLGAGTYRARYDRLLARAWAEDGAEFRECLQAAFGRAWAHDLCGLLEAGTPGDAVKHTTGLRRALAWQALIRSPGECLWGQFSHWGIELRHHLRPPFPWIAFLGPDGSGKSSVIGGVTERLAARRLQVKMIHWSPRLLRKGIEVPGGVVPDPHAKPPRGVAASLLKLGLLSAEWWSAWPWNLRHPRAKSRFLFSDRYYQDLRVDPRRYRFGAPLSWARICFRFLPQPDRVLILTGEPEQIHARKQEVTLEELKRQTVAYRALADELGGRAVRLDAGLPLGEVIRLATAAVVETCQARDAESRRRQPQRPVTAAIAPHSGPAASVAAEPAHAPAPPPPRRGPLQVLVSAYACSPVRGAEANVAWNLVRELSQRHELWVMTRTNNRVAIEASGEDWLGRVRWVYLDPPRALSLWRQGQRGVHPFYLWWQWLARGRARRLMRGQHFDVAHHMTFGTYLVPSPLGDLGVPLVFGPVGGGERSPAGLASSSRFSGRWEEWQRDMNHYLVRNSKFLRHWYHAIAWTLAATPVTAEVLRRMGVTRISMMPQSATGGDAVEQFAKTHAAGAKRAPGPLRLVTASRLIHWKAIDLALEAVAAARAGGLDVRLTVLQEGPEAAALQRQAEALGLAKAVKFTGRLPTLDDVFQKMTEADALLHPALHEAFGQACLEALALGVPVICLDWGGPGLIIDSSCGFKVEPSGRAETVAALADAIRKLDAETAAGRDFHSAAKKRAGDFRWSQMAAEIEEIYAKVAKSDAAAGPQIGENR